MKKTLLTLFLGLSATVSMAQVNYEVGGLTTQKTQSIMTRNVFERSLR